MKLLITGKNSYIANSFKTLVNEKFNDKMSIDIISLRNVDIKKLDLTLYDAILHLAGIAHVDTFNINKNEQKKYYDINTDLTYKLSLRAKECNVKYFYYSSSIIVFGKKSFKNDNYVIDENTIPMPNNFYGDSKLKAEEKIKEVYDNGNYGIIRIPMVYGKNCKGNFNALIKFAKKLPIFPSLKNKKSAIYIDNLVYFIFHIIYNNMVGVFYPQNNTFFSTCDVVKEINDFYYKNKIAKKMKFISIFNPLLKFLSKIISYLGKAFSDMYVNENLSDINFNYNIVEFKEGIINSINYDLE